MRRRSYTSTMNPPPSWADTDTAPENTFDSLRLDATDMSDEDVTRWAELHTQRRLDVDQYLEMTIPHVRVRLINAFASIATFANESLERMKMGRGLSLGSFLPHTVAEIFSLHGQLSVLREVKDINSIKENEAGTDGDPGDRPLPPKGARRRDAPHATSATKKKSR